MLNQPDPGSMHPHNEENPKTWQLVLKKKTKIVLK